MANNKKPKFIIVSPLQIDGGPIVLHALCKNLQDLGYNSRIYYCYNPKYTEMGFFGIKNFFGRIKSGVKCIISRLFPKYAIKNKRYIPYTCPVIKGCKVKRTKIFDRKNTVVIYPESIYGNFLKAKNIVRYLLYYYNYKNDKDAYNNDDLFVCYREIFNDFDLNPNKYMFCISYFDLNLYRQTNFGERTGTCYIVRKGANRPDLPKSFDGPVIDNMTEREIVEVFNKCEKCISYDTQTAYSAIASICGCLSIVVPEEEKTRNDYLANGEERFGVAFGESKEEIDYALSTQTQAIEKYKMLNEQGLLKTKEFAKLCEKYFNLQKE